MPVARVLCDVPEIDGSAGGGQLLRWALTMSAVTERSFEMHGIRGARDTPGLRPQHVAAVEAIGALTEATTEGVEVGSERITFRPTRRPYGSVSVDIGTAGSIPLVFDTVLPLAAAIEDPVSVTATGGTDVKWSPPIDYTRHVKLPLLSDLGIDAGIEVERRGFYPKGQGRARLTVEPSKVTQVDITERGGIEKVSVHSVASTDLRDASVADRQAATAEDELRGRVKAPVETSVSYDETASTGSVIVIAARFRDAAAGFNALGEPGKPAEDVAGEAVDSFRSFLDGPGAVDVHLADQLLPFLGIGGGSVSTDKVSDHIETSMRILERFGAEMEIVDYNHKVDNRCFRTVSQSGRDCFDHS